MQCCNFLGEALPEVFSPTAEGFGQGAVSGSRQKMVESRELLLAATLGKGLGQYVDQSAMAVKAWKNRDKISTAFLLELPGPHNSWPSAEWSEALCLILSLPSNACISTRNLGQPIGERYVDMFGCEVLCATLPVYHRLAPLSRQPPPVRPLLSVFRSGQSGFFNSAQPPIGRLNKKISICFKL